MRKKILLMGTLGLTLSSLSVTGCGRSTTKDDSYDEEGNLRIELRNLYFGEYQGGGEYLKRITNKFKVNFSFESYSNEQNWERDVTNQITDPPDVFHANITNYNFATTYKDWAKEEVIKPLPQDLSKWPNIKSLIENTSNIDALTLNGRVYGIPIAKNTSDPDIKFSPFTYIYRRDWAKQWGVYQENDEYTWAQFEDLLAAFVSHLDSNKDQYALGDVEWGFPSVTNFYKQSPHCYAYDAVNDKYVCNYTTPEYLEGLQKSREFCSSSKKYYYPSQNTLFDGDMRKKFDAGKIGVFYENISYSNYVAIRNEIMQNFSGLTPEELNDRTAIMKVRGENGKYALEGTDNWFSMTLFDNRISDKKQEKVLDVLDWLLSPEGTEFAVYGIEGYDYMKDPDTGKITINESSWFNPEDGSPIVKNNGATYLRYMASLGYDLVDKNPQRDVDAVDTLSAWEAQMKTALNSNQLSVFKEKDEVMWLDTFSKSLYSEGMRSDANKYAMQYSYGNGIYTIDEFKGKFNTSTWNTVLNEINRALHKI